MRRQLAAALITLVACGDNLSAPDDAGADSGGAVDATDAAPTEIDGVWSVEWTCVDLCVFDPAIALTNRVDVGAGHAVWSREGCVDCTIDHDGAPRGTCLDVPAGLDNANDDRDAYGLCADGPSAIRGEVGMRRIGGVPQTSRWLVTGTRL